MKVYYKQVQLNPTTATDYTDLLNKPAINGVDLEGDLSTEQIKVTWFGTQAEFDALGTYDPYTFYIIDDGVPVGEQQDYLDLSNKPAINGQVLTGNKLSSDLNMYTTEEVDNMLASLRSIKVVAALPSAPLANTMYYVGPDSEGVYMVYLFDSVLNRIDLGPSVQKLYTAGKAVQINEATNVLDVKFDDDTIKTNTSNQLYAVDATKTQKGIIKYDDNTIKKNSNGQLYTLPPVGAEIKVFDTSFDPNTALGNSTWTEITESDKLISTTFVFNKQSNSTGVINATTKTGNTVTFKYVDNGVMFGITGSTNVIPKIHVTSNVQFTGGANSNGYGICGCTASAQAFTYAWGFVGSTFTSAVTANSMDGTNATFGGYGSFTTLGQSQTGKTRLSADYEVWKHATDNNTVTMVGSVISSGTYCNLKFNCETSPYTDKAWPFIYQRGQGNNMECVHIFEVFERASAGKTYKIWKRTA